MAKFRKKVTKEIASQTTKTFQELQKKKGWKVLGFYWTLGRYDAVLIIEAPNEKELMKLTIRFGDLVATETMVAIPRDEAIKLIES